MAKKKDNTILWVAALAIGGYYLYKKHEETAASPATSATIPATPNPVKVPSANSLALALPPSNILNSNQPLSAASASSAPNPAALNTTGLVPATIINNSVVLQPGQTLAVNPNGTPVQNTQGIPLVFPGPINTYSDTSVPQTLAQEKQTRILELMSGPEELDEGECL